MIIDNTESLSADEFADRFFGNNESILSWDCVCGERHAIDKKCDRYGIDRIESGKRKKAEAMLLAESPNSTPEKRQTVLEYIRNATYAMFAGEIDREIIDEGITDAIITIYDKIDMYSNDRGEFHSWAISISKMAVREIVRRAMEKGTFYEISLESVLSPQSGREYTSKNMLRISIEDEYDFGVDELALLRRKVQRKIAINVFGDEIYEMALDEIRRGESGWVKRLSITLGTSSQAIYARMSKARKEYKNVGGPLIENES